MDVCSRRDQQVLHQSESEESVARRQQSMQAALDQGQMSSEVQNRVISGRRKKD